MKLRIVLINEDEATGDVIEKALANAGHTLVAKLQPEDDLLGPMKSQPVDLLIVNVKSTEHHLLRQIQSINNSHPLPIIMFTEMDSSNMIDEVIHSGVNAYVVDGLEAGRIEPIIGVALARFNQMQGLQKELAETKQVLEERKIIDRAKGIIMEKRSCNEDEAYRSLRKVAMDKNQRLAEVAENVISTAELLG